MTYENIGKTAIALNRFCDESIDGASISKNTFFKVDWRYVRNNDNETGTINLNLSFVHGESTKARFAELCDQLQRLGWTARAVGDVTNNQQRANGLWMGSCVAPVDVTEDQRVKL